MNTPKPLVSNIVESDTGTPNIPPLASHVTTENKGALPATTDTKQDDHTTVSLKTLHNIPVTVSAVLGQKKIEVSSLLNLDAGSIIDIDKKIGEPIDLYVNDTLVARGELVMLDGNLGISMTEIINTQDIPEVAM